MHMGPFEVEDSVSDVGMQGAVHVGRQLAYRQHPVVPTLEGEEPALVLLMQVPQIVESHAALLCPLAQQHPLVAGIRAGSEVDEPIRNEAGKARDNRVKPRVVDADLHLVHPVSFVNSSDEHLHSLRKHS